MLRDTSTLSGLLDDTDYNNDNITSPCRQAGNKKEKNKQLSAMVACENSQSIMS